MRTLSVLAVTAAGAAVGWLCGLVPVWPVARLTAAALLGSVVGCVGAIVLTLFTLARSESGGLGAVSFGLSEAVLFGVPLVVLIAVAAYFSLLRLGWSPTSVAMYGPVIFGGGAALVTAAWVVRAMAAGGS